MKIVLQRVNRASVTVDGVVVAEIGKGLVALVGFGRADSAATIRKPAEKLINLRVFSDGQGRFQHSITDIGGELLLVPNFTLYADTAKGRRPDLNAAMPPESAAELFQQFRQICSELGAPKVATGIFGAEMKVSLENDGPVTLLVQS